MNFDAAVTELADRIEPIDLAGDRFSDSMAIVSTEDFCGVSPFCAGVVVAGSGVDAPPPMDSLELPLPEPGGNIVWPFFPGGGSSFNDCLY